MPRFTLSDETMESIAGLAKDLNAGVHIPVAEAPEDRDAGERLARWASDDWLIIHGVHLTGELPGTLVHNAVSNTNNSVGYARPASRANRIALGTDGIGGDMIDAFRFAFVRHREDDLDASPQTAWSWLENGWGSYRGQKRSSSDPMDAWHLVYTPGVWPLDVTIDGERVLRDAGPRE